MPSPPNPFRQPGLHRLNELAAKFDQPLFTWGYRVLSAGAAVALAAGIWYLKLWVEERITHSPTITAVSAKVGAVDDREAAVEKLVADNQAVTKSLAAGQREIRDYLKDAVKTQQQVAVTLSALAQKVDDVQHHAEGAEQRMDARLNELASRPR